MAKANSKTHYGCAGSCGGEITGDKFIAGQKTCGEKTCNQCGTPLEKMKYCPTCDEFYMPEAGEHADWD